MKNCVILRKIGKFYNVFDDDAYILYYFFGYKIVNNKTGFPITAYNKVINLLEEKNINYEEKDDEVINKNFKNKNKYNYYLKEAKLKKEQEEKNNEIVTGIMSLTNEEIDKVYEVFYIFFGYKSKKFSK